MSIDDDTENFEEAFSDALPPGSKLLSGQYEILRYLSSGGFGITYLAKDSLNRTVVIKECFPEAFCRRVNRTVRARTGSYVEDFRSTVQLFVKEAHALSKLKHPSVVGVHQVFEDNETAYMALDLVDGQDLLDIIETGSPKMPAEAVRKMTLKLLSAIAHVHERDLLHRDISPDNILVDKTGHPVLIDFGAAREEASRKSRVMSSVMVVKDGYSPQEFYVAGSQQQPCSDLYALAATLSHLITGEAPPNSQARLAALASKQPDPFVPLKGRFPGYDDAFLEAIDTAMNIAPAERLQSADDWVLRIDHSKRIELARAQAQSDKTIDQTVMALVKSERQTRAQARHRAPAARAEAEAGVASPSPDSQGRSQETQNVLDLSGELDADGSDVIGLEALAETRDTTPSRDLEIPDEKPTPYVRVTSRAQQLAQKKEVEEKTRRFALPSRARVQRLATVPVVFCAYFFYAQTALQYEAIHSVTIKPLVALGAGIGDFSLTGASEQSSSVVVRRGTGD